jgi:hypothetical protein
MKLMKHLILMFVVAYTAGSAWAQTNPVDTAAQPKREGKVLVPERSTLADSGNTAVTGLRPLRPERPNLPPEVQNLVERFKQDARAYRERQDALARQLQGANDKDRAAIRQQLEALRNQWVERSKEIRKEYKERQAELADKLTDYRELLDNVRSTTVQDSGGRPRRGED